MFINEIEDVLIPKREEDDMELEITPDLSKENVQQLTWYTPDVHSFTMGLLEDDRKCIGDASITADVINYTKCKLQEKSLPTYKLVQLLFLQ